MPSPLAPRIRLASRFNWPSVVPYLSKLDICLDPSAAGTSGCKCVLVLSPPAISALPQLHRPLAAGSCSGRLTAKMCAQQHHQTAPCSRFCISAVRMVLVFRTSQMRGFYPKCAVTMTLSEADPVIKAEFGEFVELLWCQVSLRRLATTRDRSLVARLVSLQSARSCAPCSPHSGRQQGRVRRKAHGHV